MSFGPGLRRLVLTVHVTCAVGWLGAVVAYLALALAALTRGDGQTVRAAWIGMDVIARFVIVPLALTSVLVGVINALGTSWGLFRHYWVLVKLALTVLATVVLLLHMPTVTYHAGVAAASDGAGVGGLTGEIFHAGGGLIVLFATTVLSVYKPRGMTRYGWGKGKGTPGRSPG